MKWFSHALSREESGGVVLSSSLHRGNEYAKCVKRLTEGRLRSCRAVLALTALLSVLMPLMEHLLRWDRFLQGGPDLEFGILGVLLFAGVILLIAHQAATSPFFSLLFSCRLIAFPRRCLLVRASWMLVFLPACVVSGGGVLPLPVSVSGTQLRI